MNTECLERISHGRLDKAAGLPAIHTRTTMVFIDTDYPDVLVLRNTGRAQTLLQP